MGLDTHHLYLPQITPDPMDSTATLDAPCPGFNVLPLLPADLFVYGSPALADLKGVVGVSLISTARTLSGPFSVCLSRLYYYNLAAPSAQEAGAVAVVPGLRQIVIEVSQCHCSPSSLPSFLGLYEYWSTTTLSHYGMETPTP
jgi:hypothetical protein